MSVYVVDASVVLKWYVPEIHSVEALRLMEPGNALHVPDLMQTEAGNILWKKAGRGELTTADALRIANAILSAPLIVHATAPLLDGALDLALRTGRTVYDALYLALAIALRAPLVTADRRLANALHTSPFGRHVVWVEDVPEIR